MVGLTCVFYWVRLCELRHCTKMIGELALSFISFLTLWETFIIIVKLERVFGRRSNCICYLFGVFITHWVANINADCSTKESNVFGHMRSEYWMSHIDEVCVRQAV